MADIGQQEALLRTGALQTATFNSASLFKMATDASRVIQIFNVGADRMPGCAAVDVMNRITPFDLASGFQGVGKTMAVRWA